MSINKDFGHYLKRLFYVKLCYNHIQGSKMGKNNNNELKEIALKWKKSEYSNCDLLNLLDNFDINPTIKEYSRAVRNGYASYDIRLIYLMIAHYYFEKHKNNVSDFESLKLLNKGLQMFVDLNEFSTIGETLKDITVEEKEAYLADKERFKELVNFHYLKFLVLTSNNKIYTQPLAMISYMKGFLIALKVITLIYYLIFIHMMKPGELLLPLIMTKHSKLLF